MGTDDPYEALRMVSLAVDEPATACLQPSTVLSLEKVLVRVLVPDLGIRVVFLLQLQASENI